MCGAGADCCMDRTKIFRERGETTNSTLTVTKELTDTFSAAKLVDRRSFTFYFLSRMRFTNQTGMVVSSDPRSCFGFPLFLVWCLCLSSALTFLPISHLFFSLPDSFSSSSSSS